MSDPNVPYDHTHQVAGDLQNVTTTGRTCLVCGEPVLLAYMPGNPEPTDILHAINVGQHLHDAATDLTDIEDALYGQPPEGWDS